MKAIERFRATMERCNLMLAASRESSTDKQTGQELQRYVVVLSVAAMERYVKDAFLEHLTQTLRDGQCDQDLQQIVMDSGITSEFWEKCCRERASRPYRTVRNVVTRHLSTFSVQTEQSISALFKGYGLGSILKHAKAKAGTARIEKSLNKVISRRHQIAHAGDYGRQGNITPIDYAYAERRRKDIEAVVLCMEEIIQNKFSRKRKSRNRRENKADGK